MTPLVINDEALDHVVSKLDSFVWTNKDEDERELARQEFRTTYNKEKIENLKKEDYYAGLGRKQGCIAYDLEWGTKKLGSIKGGSKYKYGYETDFTKIKTLLLKVVTIDPNKVYESDGSLTKEAERTASLSKEINGFKTGKTVLPKLLSIYYSKTFIPIFNDQDHFLSKLLSSGLDTENTGLYQYLEFNYKLLKVKERLEEVTQRIFTNFEFTVLLYHSFPKEEIVTDGEIIVKSEKQEEQKFEALEVQHYQSLLHRNFHRLFPKLKYFDDEGQIPKNGQYDTQTVGIMDMLCVCGRQRRFFNNRN